MCGARIKHEFLAFFYLMACFLANATKPSLQLNTLCFFIKPTCRTSVSVFCVQWGWPPLCQQCAHAFVADWRRVDLRFPLDQSVLRNTLGSWALTSVNGVFRSPKRVAFLAMCLTFQFIAGDGCAVRLVDVDDIPPVIAVVHVSAFWG